MIEPNTEVYCRNRLFEWISVLALLGLGFMMLRWPTTIEASAFRFMLTMVSESTITIMYLLASCFRVCALIANGRWPTWGPQIRAAGALLGAIIWGQMCFALIRLAPELGIPPSPGIPVYAALVFGEVYSVHRAITDGKSYWR